MHASWVDAAGSYLPAGNNVGTCPSSPAAWTPPRLRHSRLRRLKPGHTGQRCPPPADPDVSRPPVAGTAWHALRSTAATTTSPHHRGASTHGRRRHARRRAMTVTSFATPGRTLTLPAAQGPMSPWVMERLRGGRTGQLTVTSFDPLDEPPAGPYCCYEPALLGSSRGDPRRRVGSRPVRWSLTPGGGVRGRASGGGRCNARRGSAQPADRGDDRGGERGTVKSRGGVTRRRCDGHLVSRELFDGVVQLAGHV